MEVFQINFSGKIMMDCSRSLCFQRFGDFSKEIMCTKQQPRLSIYIETKSTAFPNENVSFGN